MLALHTHTHTGENVAFYFAWMNFYTTYIIIPAVIGLAMYLFRPAGVTVDDDAYLPFFSIIMALWGVLFLIVSECSDKLSFIYLVRMYCCLPQTEITRQNF